jgi:hypothetical protein
LFEKTLLVWAAVSKRARHALHHTFRRRSLPNQIDYSRDAAHDFV